MENKHILWCGFLRLTFSMFCIFDVSRQKHKIFFNAQKQEINCNYRIYFQFFILSGTITFTKTLCSLNIKCTVPSVQFLFNCNYTHPVFV